MADELIDREYQAGRAGLNDGIDRGFTALGRQLRAAFEVLNRINWNAPWRAGRGRPRRRSRHRGMA